VARATLIPLPPITWKMLLFTKFHPSGREVSDDTMNGLDWLRRFAPLAAKLKVEVQLGTDEATHYLRLRQAEAAMLGPLDDEGYVIYFLSTTPTASAVLEEFGHLLQVRRKHFSAYSHVEMAIRREIEAHECLDEHAQQWALPESEQEQTRVLLQRERDTLVELKRWD